MTEKHHRLEQILVDSCNSDFQFPDRGVDYAHRYFSIKQWLTAGLYKQINACLARDGGTYTDHGVDHFDEVIRFAYEIAYGPNVKSEDTLNGYEVYLLLVAILLHDVGNIYGREDHEKKVHTVMRKIGSLAGEDTVEKTLICKIAQAHGGKTINNDKDTISSLLDEENEDNGVRFRPQLLAAILRFADEICENRCRASNFLMEEEVLDKRSEAYHYYASTIRTVRVDHDNKRVKLKFELKLDIAGKLYGKDDHKIFIADEILSRLEKMHTERMYCSRFFRSIAKIEQVDAEIEILTPDCERVIMHKVNMRSSGYPQPNICLATKYPHLTGRKILEEHVKVTK